MARIKRYNHPYPVRLSDDGEKHLKKRIKRTGEKPAVALRNAAEHTLAQEASK